MFSSSVPLSLDCTVVAVGLSCFALYWVLCEQRWERDVIVPRLKELAEVETDALRGTLGAPEDVRMHSVGVEV
mgnify:CR=1 FL=1